jgi:hypothetical protein
MSYISSYLRTNSFNCSSISEEKLRSTQYDKTLETFCRRRSWISASESSRIPDWLGPVPSRQTFSLGDGDGTELRLDGDVPVGVNISIYTHMRKYFSSVTFRDGTETWRIAWIGLKTYVWFTSYCIHILVNSPLRMYVEVPSIMPSSYIWSYHFFSQRTLIQVTSMIFLSMSIRIHQQTQHKCIYTANVNQVKEQF